MWRRPCPTAGWRRGGDRRRGIIANPDRLPRSGAEGGGEPSMNAKRILRIAAVLLAGWLAACTARYPVVGAFDDYDEVFIRSEEHTSELQSLMRIPYAVICLNNKKH